MWRLLLILSLSAALLTGVALAQIDRNSGSRNAAPKKPRKPAAGHVEDKKEKPRSDAVELSAEQLALAEAIYLDCGVNAAAPDAGVEEAQSAPGEPAAQAQAAAAAEDMAPVPEATTPAEDVQSQAGIEQADTAEQPPAATDPPAARDEVDSATPADAWRKLIGEPAPAAVPEPPAPIPAAEVPAPAKDDTGAQTVDSAAADTADTTTAPETTGANDAAGGEGADNAPLEAISGPEAPPANAGPAADTETSAPEPAAVPATAVAPPPPVEEPAVKSRRPVLKMTKRERNGQPTAAVPAPKPEDGQASGKRGISEAELALAASATAAELRQHAFGLEQQAKPDAKPAATRASESSEDEPAQAEDDTPVPDDSAAPAEAAADAEPVADPADAGAAGSAEAGAFDEPFSPRSNNTTLEQLTSRSAAPRRAAPPQRQSPASGVDNPAPAADIAGEAAAPAVATAALAPLPAAKPSAAAGTLASAYGGGAPVELLLPREAGRMPDYPVRADLQVLNRGNAKKKQVALTFDDGPHPQFTSQILAELQYYGVPATFFFTGLQAQKYPQWVRMAHQAGHEIGNHTYDHFRIPKLPRTEQEYQIDEYQRLIEGLVGVKPRFLRPPGGQLDKATQQLIAKRGMVVAMWDVNVNDVKAGKSEGDLLKTTLKNIRSGSVILAHDGIQSTIDMLPELITTLRGQGYTFVTLSELASGI